MTAEFGCGAARTMGYMGCSMSVNVATGYQRRMGMRMWGPQVSYGGQVVQNWTPTSGGPWTAFDQQASANGKPTDIWMQICIFAQQGVTAAEVQTMIKNARAHSTPTTQIWITGQPLYNSGHTCSLAGTGGAELTEGERASRDVLELISDHYRIVVRPSGTEAKLKYYFDYAEPPLAGIASGAADGAGAAGSESVGSVADRYAELEATVKADCSAVYAELARRAGYELSAGALELPDVMPVQEKARYKPTS